MIIILITVQKSMIAEKTRQEKQKVVKTKKNITKIWLEKERSRFITRKKTER